MHMEFVLHNRNQTILLNYIRLLGLCKGHTFFKHRILNDETRQFLNLWPMCSLYTYVDFVVYFHSVPYHMDHTTYKIAILKRLPIVTWYMLGRRTALVT